MVAGIELLLQPNARKHLNLCTLLFRPSYGLKITGNFHLPLETSATSQTLSLILLSPETHGFGADGVLDLDSQTQHPLEPRS